MKKKIGQITIKKIGEKYAACISGTPQELFNSYDKAKGLVEKLRIKYGRRNYKKRKKKRIRKGKKGNINANIFKLQHL